MSSTTTINGLRYATLTDPPNAQTGFQQLAEDVDTRVIPRFATTGARDTAIPVPVQGMYCDVSGVGLQRYSGTAWVTYGQQQTFIVRKVTTETVTSSTTFQDDNELLRAVEANSTYDFEFRLAVTGGTGGDIKLQLTYPGGGPTLEVFAIGPALAVADPADTNYSSYATLVQHTSPSSAGSFGITAAQEVIEIKGTLYTGSSSGTLTLQWAQNTSNGTGTSVLNGSSLRVDKLA